MPVPPGDVPAALILPPAFFGRNRQVHYTDAPVTRRFRVTRRGTARATIVKLLFVCAYTASMRSPHFVNFRKHRRGFLSVTTAGGITGPERRSLAHVPIDLVAAIGNGSAGTADVVVYNHYAHKSLEEDLQRRVFGRNSYYKEMVGAGAGKGERQVRAELMSLVDREAAAFLADPSPAYSDADDVELAEYFGQHLLQRYDAERWTVRGCC